MVQRPPHPGRVTGGQGQAGEDERAAHPGGTADVQPDQPRGGRAEEDHRYQREDPGETRRDGAAPAPLEVAPRMLGSSPVERTLRMPAFPAWPSIASA